jgi:small subunit ribosomal protein S17
MSEINVERGNRKERIGKVVSNKMAKTIVVCVERRFPHPKFHKVVTSFAKFHAHDEKAEAKIGDVVRIQETRPLSRLKRWRLVEIVEKNVDTAVVAA